MTNSHLKMKVILKKKKQSQNFSPKKNQNT